MKQLYYYKRFSGSCQMKSVEIVGFFGLFSGNISIRLSGWLMANS